jgi:hypothetical protein
MSVDISESILKPSHEPIAFAVIGGVGLALRPSIVRVAPAMEAIALATFPPRTEAAQGSEC